MQMLLLMVMMLGVRRTIEIWPALLDVSALIARRSSS
jgi:hypothetical protein